MMRFLLFFLTILFSGFYAKAQQSKAKEIVKLALKKHTGGKVLNRYEVKVKFQKPGETPSIYLQDPFAGAIDSIKATLSDSAKLQFQMRIDKGKADIYQRYVEYNTEKQYLYRVDIESKKMAQIIRGYNQAIDSLDMVAWQDIYNSDYFFIRSFKLNPVALLQLMHQDTAQLHYTESATIAHTGYYIVQVKVREKWLSVYFNQQTYLVDRLIEPKVDHDAYFGQDNYNEIVLYSNYKNHNGFLLPETIEEITSILSLSKIENVSWLSINKPFPAVMGK
jgi:hypothetical protein